LTLRIWSEKRARRLPHCGVFEKTVHPQYTPAFFHIGHVFHNSRRSLVRAKERLAAMRLNIKNDLPVSNKFKQQQRPPMAMKERAAAQKCAVYVYVCG
jgi:hypothetical protein